MALNKKERTTQEAGTSNQAPQRALRSSHTSTVGKNRGNMPHPLSLTNPEHMTICNALSGKLVVATLYYDEDVLNHLGLLDDICWFFAGGGMGQFLETRDHTYRDLILEVLSTLHVEITSGP